MKVGDVVQLKSQKGHNGIMTITEIFSEKCPALFGKATCSYFDKNGKHYSPGFPVECLKHYRPFWKFWKRESRKITFTSTGPLPTGIDRGEYEVREPFWKRFWR